MAEPQVSVDLPLDLTTAEIPPASRVHGLPSIHNLLALSRPRDGKARHEQVNKLVWAFREQFNYDINQPFGGADYLKALVQFELASPALDAKVRSAISHFATPAHYSEVRDCYRMRASRKVSDAELVKLAREVNAALIWRELR